MLRFGARAQPGASALRPRVLLTVPVRVSYTPRASPDIPSHHARSVDSRTPHTVSAHAARHRPRCPSTRNPSNIYPNHGRTPRHHRARAARSPWAIVAWCSCGCSCACMSTATSASMAARVAAGAAGSRRIRRLRSQDRAHAAGRRLRRPSGGARWPRTRHWADEHIVQHHVVVAVEVHECDNWAVLPVSTTLASAFEQPMTVATMYRLATMEPLNSGSKGLWGFKNVT